MPKESAPKRTLPSKKTGQGAHSKEERGRELYPTPPELTRVLLAHEQLPQAIWEPAAGMGDMVLPLVEAGKVVWASDIEFYPRRSGWVKVNQRDFFEFTKAPMDIDCIVTNPPFSLGDRFVRHALKLCPKVCVLMRLAFLEGVRRSDILDSKLARLLVIKERPPMMHRWSLGSDGLWREWEGKKADSAMPFAWFVFESGHNGDRDGILTRRVSWRAQPGVPTKRRGKKS